MRNFLTVLAVLYVLSGGIGLVQIANGIVSRTLFGDAASWVALAVCLVSLFAGVQLYRERYVGLVIVRAISLVSIVSVFAKVLTEEGSMFWDTVKVASALVIAGAVWAPAAARVCTRTPSNKGASSSP